MNDSETTLRISKSHGNVMIFVGVLFDLLPFITATLTVFLMVFYLSDAGRLMEMKQEYDACNVTREELNEMPFWEGLTSGFKSAFACGDLAWQAVNGGVKAIVSALVGGLIVAPLLYTLVSWVSTAIAYLLFTVWFLFKGVNIWSITKTKKIIMTVSTLIIENIPLVDLLPGTTIMVWRQVKASQIEDRKKAEQRLSENQRFPRRARRRQPAYA